MERKRQIFRIAHVQIRGRKAQANWCASAFTVTWRDGPGLVCDYTNTCTSLLWRGWDLRVPSPRPLSVVGVAQQPYVSRRNHRVGKTTRTQGGRRANTTKSWAAPSSRDVPLKVLWSFWEFTTDVGSKHLWTRAFVRIASSIIQPSQAFSGWNEKKKQSKRSKLTTSRLSCCLLALCCYPMCLWVDWKHKRLCFDALQLRVGGADLRPPAGAAGPFNSHPPPLDFPSPALLWPPRWHATMTGALSHLRPEPA